MTETCVLSSQMKRKHALSLHRRDSESDPDRMRRVFIRDYRDH